MLFAVKKKRLKISSAYCIYSDTKFSQNIEPNPEKTQVFLLSGPCLAVTFFLQYLVA